MHLPTLGGTLHFDFLGDDVNFGGGYQRSTASMGSGPGRLNVWLGVLAGNRDLAINASIPDGIVPNSEYYAYHSPATTPEGFTSFPYFEPGPSVGGTAILTYDHQFEVGLSAGISLILPKSVPLLGGALADYTTYDADHPHAAGALGALTDLIVGNPSIMGNSVWNQQSDAGMYIGGRLWGRFAGF
jgi:hypothetical protein